MAEDWGGWGSDEDGGEKRVGRRVTVVMLWPVWNEA